MQKPYVYKWTDSSNGKSYIGSHNGSKSFYKGSGKLFKRAYKKRPECFSKEILYQGTKEDVLELEEFILEELDAANNPMYYNLINKSNGADYWKGKNLSDIHREKISKGGRGLKRSETTKTRISESRKKRVYCGSLDKEFRSITDCAKTLGVSQPYLSEMIYGKYKNTYGVILIQK